MGIVLAHRFVGQEGALEIDGIVTAAPREEINGLDFPVDWVAIVVGRLRASTWCGIKWPYGQISTDNVSIRAS